jgi:hypothetical protein
MRYGFFTPLAITLLLLAASCRSSTASAAFTAVTVKLPNGNSIDGAMTDPQILDAFSVPGSAKKDFVQGKDGTSTTYAIDGQRVTITRSEVSGVCVTATGRIAGDWPLSRAR